MIREITIRKHIKFVEEILDTLEKMDIKDGDNIKKLLLLHRNLTELLELMVVCPHCGRKIAFV